MHSALLALGVPNRPCIRRLGRRLRADLAPLRHLRHLHALHVEAEALPGAGWAQLPPTLRHLSLSSFANAARVSLPPGLLLDSLTVHCPGQPVFLGLGRALAQCRCVLAAGCSLRLLLQVRPARHAVMLSALHSPATRPALRLTVPLSSPAVQALAAGPAERLCPALALALAQSCAPARCLAVQVAPAVLVSNASEPATTVAAQALLLAFSQQERVQRLLLEAPAGQAQLKLVASRGQQAPAAEGRALALGQGAAGRGMPVPPALLPLDAVALAEAAGHINSVAVTLLGGCTALDGAGADERCHGLLLEKAAPLQHPS